MNPRRSAFSRTVFFAGLLSISSGGSAWAESSPQALVARAEEALAHNHPGRAILNLERARRLSPSSPRIADDLARARVAAKLPSTEPQVAGTPAQLLRTDHWGDVALAGLGLAAGALVAVVWKLGRRAFLIIGLLGGVVATVGFWATIRAEPPPNLAVVVARDLVARVAPSFEATALFAPREGSLVSVDRTQGLFVLITVDGRRGWVPTGDVETILPES